MKKSYNNPLVSEQEVTINDVPSVSCETKKEEEISE